MKILMTTSFYPPFHIGGDALHVKGLAKALVKKGHDVHIMHSIDAYDLKRDDGANLRFEDSKIKIHSIKAPNGVKEVIKNYTFGTQEYTLKFYHDLINKYKFDVVHHHNISLLGYNILKKVGKYKQLYTAHDYWLICHKYDLLRFGKPCENKDCFICSFLSGKPYQFFRNSKKFKEAINDIDKVIAPSGFMKEKLSELINAKKIKVIHNFSNIENNHDEKIKEDYFVYVGVLEKHKGILELLRLFRKSDEKLIVIGDGSLFHKCRELAYKQKNIKLTGRIEQEKIMPIVNKAKALIIPSIWYENCPLTIIESYSQGTPAIGTDLGGIPELISLVDEKLIFESKDFRQLAEIINNFRPKKYDSKNIRKIYNRRFRINNFLKKYERLLI